MAKKWYKFLKDHDQDDKNKFKKDQVLLLEDDDNTKSLETLKFIVTTDAPKLDDTIKKSIEDAQKALNEAIEEMITKSLTQTADNINKKAKKAIVNVTGEESPIQKYGRQFQNDADFFMAVLKSSGDNSTKDERFTTKAPTGVNTLDDTEGGFLIPDTIVSGIWTNMQEDQAALLPRTDQRQTSGNNMKFVRMNEISRKSGYRHGGIVAYWTEEAGEFTASQPKWGKFGLDLHKITVLCYVTEEEIADAQIAIAPVLSRLAARAINFLVNESFLWGTGVGKPKGIMREDSLITVSKETSQSNGTILHKNISKMYHRLHPDYRQGAVWMVHPNLEEQLEFLTFLDATVSQSPIPIYFSPGQGMNALTGSNKFGTLKGLPVIPCEYCKDLGTKGDIVLANWGEYITLVKANGGIKSAESMHVRFLFEERAFRFSFRIGGASPWSAPKEDYNGTTTRGPFVTLEDRSAAPTSSGL